MVHKTASENRDNLTADQIEQLRGLDATLSEVFDLLENDTPRAGDFLEQILLQLEDNPLDEFQRRRAYAQLLLSRLNYRHMNFHKAIALGLESLATYEMLEDISGQHETNYLLGIYHIRFNDNVQAMDNLMRAVELAEQLKDPKGIGSASMILSVVFRNMGHYNRAFEQLNYALRMKHEAEDVYGEAVVYSNIARTHAAMKNFEKAIKYAEKAITLSRRRQAEYLLVSSKLVLGEVYAQANKHTEAIQQFEKCLKLCHQHEWLELEVSISSKVGSAYLGVGNIEKAIEVLHNGLEMSEQHLSNYITLEILDVLVQVYEKQEDFKQAYLYLQKLHKLQQQLIEAERTERLSALEMTYQMRIAREEANSQRMRAEELELRAQQDREYFAQLNKLRDEFLSAATHDLKNPLSAIRTSTYLLRVKIGDVSDLRRHIDTIDYQVGRMTQLITDMLDLAKLETGRSLAITETSIHNLIHEVVQDHQQIADQRNIRLICNCQTSDTDVILAIDDMLIQRAIANLVSNAIKYSPTNTAVKLLLHDYDDHVHISIIDQGIGIPEQDLPNIFKRFYRVQSGQTQAIEGTGLGLSIVKTIIDQHNGDILVESEIDKGTKFTIILPTTRNDTFS